MKKIFIIAGMLCLISKAKAQTVDSNYQYQNIDKSEIEALYSYYTQDGKHSAVTGGQGTEELNVQAVSLKAKHYLTQKFDLNWKAGVDVITSASTDKIDYVLTSASRVDRRIFADLNFSIHAKNKSLVTFGTGVSAESDYLSVPVRLNYRSQETTNGSQWNLSLDAAFDDLRWGRFNPDFYSPVRLVYPIELRSTDWFKNYRRQSYNLMSSYSILLSKKSQLAFFAGMSLQEGLLSTPFHRIYLTNGNTVIEKLPSQRIKIPLAVQMNSFISSQFILKQNLGLYKDNFDIHAISLEEELSWKANRNMYLSIFSRAYAQTASIYFKEKGEHHANDSFYTSDRDLSKFTSLNTGLELFIHPLSAGKINMIKGIGFRAAYYKRSDGLWAINGSLLVKL
ncbi:MAG: DUF3570 domain-containing protein [Bacteroidetes bacterium]|nr:DUF3570 domain-containing protein [Bacteroidota bacterium]